VTCGPELVKAVRQVPGVTWIYEEDYLPVPA